MYIYIWLHWLKKAWSKGYSTQIELCRKWVVEETIIESNKPTVFFNAYICDFSVVFGVLKGNEFYIWTIQQSRHWRRFWTFPTNNNSYPLCPNQEGARNQPRAKPKLTSSTSRASHSLTAVSFPNLVQHGQKVHKKEGDCQAHSSVLRSVSMRSN